MRLRRRAHAAELTAASDDRIGTCWAHAHTHSDRPIEAVKAGLTRSDFKRAFYNRRLKSVRNNERRNVKEKEN